MAVIALLAQSDLVTLTFWSAEKKMRWPSWSRTAPGPETSTLKSGTGAC